MQRLRLVALAGLLLAIPAAYAATAGCHAHTVGAQDSIPAARLANRGPLDEQALLTWTLHAAAHLVRLDQPIPGLPDAATIFLVTRSADPKICACGPDELLLPGAGAARFFSAQYLCGKRTAQPAPGACAPTRTRMSVT
jgi:hypothetical protein